VPTEGRLPAQDGGLGESQVPRQLGWGCMADNEGMSGYGISGECSRHRPFRGTRWVEIALATSLVLVVSIPAMIVEEDWHGHPMIEQASWLWVLPAVLVASAFLFGGALAGLRCPSTGVVHASSAAIAALTVLLLGALYRRLWFVHEGVQHAVVGLWCLGVAGALTLSVIGSLFGRRLGADRY